MFGLFKNRKKDKKHTLGAPAAGRAVSLKEVNDPTFSEGILGDGVAVVLSDGKICAPEDGTIGMIFETLHAVSLTTKYGAEILIHVGLDTVKLKGEGFEGFVKAGDTVKKGDLLLTVDIEKVKAAGYDTITPMLICNTAQFAEVKGLIGKEVAPGDDILEVTEK